MGVLTRPFIRISKRTTRHMSTWSSNRDLFEYTSGRFLFNEQRRLAERRVQFNVDALVNAVCQSTNRPASDISSLSKLTENDQNRVIQTTFKDGHNVLAKIPYKIAVPEKLAVASEVATLDLLRRTGVPVPKVLAYCAGRTNSVGAEYILLEKPEGRPLSETWLSMTNETRAEVMKQIVAEESKFLSIPFPSSGSGSLYYRRDLEETQFCISLPAQEGIIPPPDQMVFGPSTQSTWWYQERKLLDVDRGPWSDYLSCFEAPAKRELEYCKRFAKPRLHPERYLRELYHSKEMSQTAHIDLLSDYLKLAPYLNVPLDHPFAYPTLRHPNLSPDNILVDSSYNITAIIEWQNAVVLPLCLCAAVPDSFQNWGGPGSETLTKPDTNLPKDYHELSAYEQAKAQEAVLKRIAHYYYSALTTQDHFDAMSGENSIRRAEVFKRVGVPWEGNSLPLKVATMDTVIRWPTGAMAIDNENCSGLVECPVKYSEQEISQCRNELKQVAGARQELAGLTEMIGIDSLGWVPDDEQLERSRAMAQSTKEAMLENSESDVQRTAVMEHWPFDDHDEGPLDIED